MINKIIHTADIHLFLNKRHYEHKELISNFTAFLKKEKPDLIYFGGDIVDSKSKLSAEQIELVKSLFYSCASIAPVIYILGNHDINLQNKGLDSLSIIIDNLQTEYPIYFLKDTGVYTLYDIDWAVWSVLDNKNPFKELGCKKQRYTIGCFHGPVEGCKTDSGWRKFNHFLPIETFDQCDVVFLGDIHMNQFFRNKEIGFSGSLIQTKIDENENRGVIVWNWDENKRKHIPKFKPLFNSYGYKTYEIKDLESFDINKIDFPTEKFIGRLLYTGDENTFSELRFREIKKLLKEKITNTIILQKRFSKFKTIEKQNKAINSKDFFEEYFKEQNINPALVKELKKLDKGYEKQIDITDYQTGEYQIEEVEIHNFACFGANNVINFAEMNGLIGLFGENGIGKTTLFHAIMFCLFNKTPKDSKSAISLVNDQLDVLEEAFVQVKLVVNGIRWRVRRRILPNRSGDGAQIRLEVYEELNGQEEAKHLESRPQTDSQVLKPMLGDEKVFLTLVLSSQKNSVEFVDKSNSERLDLVIKFLGILLYDEKHTLVNDEIKKEELTYAVLLEEIGKIQSKTLLEELLQEIIQLMKNDKVKYNESIKSINNKESELNKLKKQLNKLSLLTVTESLPVLKNKKITQQNNITIKDKEILFFEDKKNKYEKEVSEILELKDKDILKWEIDYQSLANKEAKLNNLKDIDLNNQNEKLNSEFCPTCGSKLCDINKEEVQKEIDRITSEISDLEKEIKELKILNKKIKDLKYNIVSNNDSIKFTKEEKLVFEEKLKNTEKQIELAIKNEETIKKKNELEEQISDLEEALEELKDNKNTIHTNIEINKQKKVQIETDLKTYDKKYKEIKEKENLITNLKIYKKAMHRTGIPMMVLNNFIPLINRELSIYLADLFDFNIEFQLEDNNLEILYYYENLKKVSKRDVKQACGMEGTIINLAIRSALTKVSLLPKPSLLLLDEIFSMLDANHLEKMKDLLLRLKEEFNNIVIISHLEELKDLPEYYILLENKEGITNIA